MIVNKMTLIRMKKIAYELKQKGATDETTSITIETRGKGEESALNSLIGNNFEEYMKRKYKSIVYVASVGNEKVMKFYENNGFKMTGYTMKMETE